jgi:hypothetical protein
MTNLEELLNNIVPELYAAIIETNGLPPHFNVAQSNLCQHLSKDLVAALVTRDLSAQREYHELNDKSSWHFMVAHHDADTLPSDADIVTDLNPWQYMTQRTTDTFLHGERGQVMDILRSRGAPDWFVSLRGIHTIAQTRMR